MLIKDSKIMQTTWRNDTVIVNQENFDQTSSNFTAGEWKTTEPKPSHYEKTKIRFIDFYTRRQLKYRPVRVRNQVPIQTFLKILLQSYI